MSDLFEGKENTEAHRGSIVIFDLDGTLANAEHRIHLITGEKKNWEEFYDLADKDTPIHNIRTLCNELEAFCEIIIVTARNKKTELATRKWLKKYHIRYNSLIFVRSKDNRLKDYDLKEQWLQSFARKDKIWLVVEGRKKVGKMWRDNGLTCLQCVEGDY